jgi:hypothetical protein
MATMTDVLSRPPVEAKAEAGNPLLGGIPSPGEAAQGDTKDTTDDSRLRSVFDQGKGQMTALLGRMQATNRQKDALVPPVMAKAPKPPEEQNTPITERWGSLAMTLAAMGGLLTRQPLTASLNAMAAVNHAFNEGDAEKAKNAFATWKVENENVNKQNEFAVKSYDGALKKIETDYHGAVAELKVMSAARKDDTISALFESGRTHEAIQMIMGYASAANQYSERGDIVKAHMEQKLAFRTANPHATPAELAAADLAIMTNKFAEKPESPGMYEEGLEKKAVAEKVAEWKAKPENAGKEPSAHQQIEWKHEATATGKPETAAKGFSDIKTDLRAEHPDWTEGQLDKEANMQIASSKQPVMGDDAAEINARVALKTGHAPTSMGRSQANIAKFQDTYARIAKQDGLNADQIAANQVKFTGEMSESRALGTTSARIDFGAKELDVALPEALKLSENVYRPGFKKIAEIQQALQGQTSDPDLLEFAQQNQAVMNAYAQVMSRGGVSTVTAMDRAEKLLQTATTQQGYMRQLDRLHKETQTIQYGTQAAKQQLQNEITGRSTELPPPTLTGVPRGGQSGAAPSGGQAPKVISDKAAYDALPSGAKYLKPGDPPDHARTKP